MCWPTQPGQLLTKAGTASQREPVDAYDPSGQTDQDGCEGGASCSLRDLPNGRGGGAAILVCCDYPTDQAAELTATSHGDAVSKITVPIVKVGDDQQGRCASTWPKTQFVALGAGDPACSQPLPLPPTQATVLQRRGVIVQSLKTARDGRGQGSNGKCRFGRIIDVVGRSLWFLSLHMGNPS